MFSAEFMDGVVQAVKEARPELEGEALIKAAGELAGQALADMFDGSEALMGIDKEAAFSTLGAARAAKDTLMQPFTEAALRTLGSVAAGAAAGAGMYAIGRGAAAITGGLPHQRFEQALKIAVERSSVLRQADPAKVRSFAESIFRFAPSVAQDPNLLSTVLANAIHGESLDPATIKSLGEIEERQNKNTDMLGALKNMVLKG